MVALKEFIRKHYASLYAVAFRITGAKDVAEDIAQEVIIDFWKNPNTEAIDSVDDFLFIAVRNKTLNYLRKEKRRNYRHQKLCEEKTEENRDEVLNKLIEEEFNHIVLEAVGKLPEQSRKIMRFVLEGLNNKEIADELQLSVNTVKTLKYRAMRRMRIYLEKFYGFRSFTLFFHKFTAILKKRNDFVSA